MCVPKVSGKCLVRSQRLCVENKAVTGLHKLSQLLCGYSDARCCPKCGESVSLNHTSKSTFSDFNSILIITADTINQLNESMN